MSKWGYFSASWVTNSVDYGLDRVAKMAEEMSRAILDLEKEIDALKVRRIKDLERMNHLTDEAAELRGYIKRVRETDKIEEKPHDHVK